jgi:hypothetical protein
MVLSQMIQSWKQLVMNVIIGQKTLWWNGGKFLDKKVGGMK